MKKLLLFVGLFLSISSICFAAGTVTPFKYSKPVNPEDLRFGNEEAQATSSATSSAKVAEVMKISFYGNNPLILEQDGTWKKIVGTDDIKMSSYLKVISNSLLQFNFVNGSEVSVTNDSLITININPDLLLEDSVVIGNEISDIYSNTKNEFSLFVGKIRAKIKKYRRAQFEILTPEAVCAARGTDFIVERNQDLKVTYAYLNEGILDIDNLHGSTTAIYAGEKISVDSDGKMITTKMTQEDWANISNGTESLITSNTTNQKGTIWYLVLIVAIAGIITWFFYQK